MKVLWLANIPSPYRVAFFNELGKLCDLTVLFERRSSDERDVSWKRFDAVNFKAVFLPGRSLGVAEAFCPSVVRYLTCEYDRIVVTTFSDPTGILAVRNLKRKKIPYCLESDGAFPGSGRGLKEMLKKRIISGADMYFATAEIHDEYYKMYGAPADRIVRYPFTSLCEADILKELPDRREKHALRAALGMTEERIVLAVGQFIPRKGFDLLVKAACGLKDTGVYIVGGEAPEEYIRLKSELNARNVHFAGFKLKEELKRYYRAADVFVHPTREDIWGLVINEAMANGLPVVTTTRCAAGLQLIRNGENGFIVPVDDEKALRDAISGAFDLHWNAEIIAPYSVENMARVHMQHWRSEHDDA